ncbi:hypothetical protein ACQY0O_000991 [Thecaphora frezii]
MPSIAEKQSKSALAVHQKHSDLQQKFQDSTEAVKHLSDLASRQLLPSLSDQLDLQDEGIARVRAFLDDRATLFRFLRRARFDQQQALSLLNASLLWRIKTDLDLFSLASLHPLYVNPPPPNPPLFWLNSHFHDRFGRPCGVINLRSVERTDQNTLEQLKEYIVACMEILRRYIADLNLPHRHAGPSATKSSSSSDRVLQSVIAVDLTGSGMANLELELLPFLLDLLKNHFPGMVGAVYILHYGWVHAGMWAVAKRVLPEQALARIFFPSHAELREHFDASRIPKAYQGELEVEMDASSNDVLQKWGRPKRGPSSAYASPMASPDITKSHRALSRASSYESMYEVFYSASGTPWSSRPMTPRHSGPPTPRGDHNPAVSALRMTPNAAKKLRRLEMTRGAPASSRGSRQRTPSESHVEDAAALGLTVNTAGLSPVNTPYGGRSPAATGRRSVDTRHVHFGSPGSRAPLSPARRVGTSRSFNLQVEEEEGDGRESENESDASGKDGVKPPASPSQSGTDAKEASQEGFFARWTKRPFSLLSSAPEEVKEQPGGEGDDQTVITYIDPGSPQLQVSLLGETPLSQSVVPQHRFLSQRSRKYDGKAGHVSPYNATNPFFGYPAYITGSAHSTDSANGPHRFSLGPSGTPQHLHVRRRKRDLIRTLTYLFVLRLLAFHRRLRWKAMVMWKEVVRTMAVGGEDQTDGDRLWRMAEERHRASQGAAEKTKEAPNVSSGRHLLWYRLLYALVFIGLLKPSWRATVQRQVAAMLAPLSLAKFSTVVLTRSDRLCTYQDIEVRRTSITSPSLPMGGERSSWTGLHIREKLGVKTSAAGSSGRRNSRSRNKALAFAGSALVLTSLGIYFYSQYGKRGGKGDDGDNDDDTRRRRSDPSAGRSTTTVPGKNAKRPTMSLCLSPSFDRTDAEAMRGLKTLLTQLAPLFLVHLILPTHPLGRSHTNDDLERSLASLSSSFSSVAQFDTRRILEYSQDSGRWAIPRALACDCHVELLLPTSHPPPTSATMTLSELDKIRRTCGLVVVAAVSSTALGDETETDAVFADLRRRAANQSGTNSSNTDAPPGMRAYDLRSTEQRTAWEELAQLVASLRSSWK